MDEEHDGTTELTELKPEDTEAVKGADTQAGPDWWRLHWESKLLIRNNSGEQVVVAISPGKLKSYMTQAAGAAHVNLPSDGLGVAGLVQWAYDQGYLQMDTLDRDQQTEVELDGGAGFVTVFKAKEPTELYCVNRRVCWCRLLVINPTTFKSH